MTQSPYLANHFLIAMPNMGDPRFTQTVTLICEHTKDGALGIVVNRPLDMRLGEIFAQMSLEIEVPNVLMEQPIFFGGPVQQDRGFVIHRPGPQWDSTMAISDELELTTSRDVLTAMAGGEGPRDYIVALGYAGWGPGQLDDEMAANAWLSVPASDKILFETPHEQRWRAAANLLGVNIESLGIPAGHG